MPKSIQPIVSDFLTEPCPFCGSRSIEITNAHAACYTVACRECGAEVAGPNLDEDWKTAASKVASHRKAIRAAVVLWNRRPAPTSVGKAPARLVCEILWGNSRKFWNLGGTFGTPLDGEVVGEDA